MKAMILAAGLGTRLRPLTYTVPKPMLPLAGRPCMEHIIRLLKKHGVNDVMVNVHYLPEQIMEYFKNGSKFGMNIEYSLEKELLGTAGGLKKVQDFFKDSPILIISGDGLTDINLREFYHFHKKKGTIASLALKKVGDPQQYGVVKLRNNQCIEIFQEKPRPEEAISNLANTGIYLFQPDIFDHIPQNTFYDFGKQVFPELIGKNIPLAGFEMNGYWCDIGDLEIYREAHYDILMGLVDVEIPGEKIGKNIWVGEEVSIHPETTIVGPVVIGNNCVINKGTKIYGPAAIGSGAVLKEEVLIKRSVLWDKVVVEKRNYLMDSIVGKGAIIEKGRYLDKDIVSS